MFKSIVEPKGPRRQEVFERGQKQHFDPTSQSWCRNAEPPRSTNENSAEIDNDESDDRFAVEWAVVEYVIEQFAPSHLR
jgi:hypothetical protein